MQLSPRTKKKMYVSAVTLLLAVWAWGFAGNIAARTCLSPDRERGEAEFGCLLSFANPNFLLQEVSEISLGRTSEKIFEHSLVLAENNLLEESLARMTRLFDRIGLYWDVVQNTAPEDLLPVHRAILLRAKRIDPTTPEYSVFIAAMTRTDLQGDPQ